MPSIKAKNQRYHANLRSKERFRIKMTDKLYEKLVKDIQQNRAKFILRHSNRVGLFLVNILGKQAIAVYDKNTKQIATFLYPDWVLKKPQHHKFEQIIW